jgi:hypothetical protein
MSSIIRRGDTYHGISVDGRGVFTDEYGTTYAGQHKDGYACGLGVLTFPDGSKDYAEHGPDGQPDGRNLDRSVVGYTGYFLCERGEVKYWLVVSANGYCKYNGEDCAPDDPRVLALLAQVAPVEVRPATPAPRLTIAAHLAPKPSSDQPARFAPAGACDRGGQRGASPRRTQALVAVLHKATTAHYKHDQTRSRAVPRSGRTGGTPRAP